MSSVRLDLPEDTLAEVYDYAFECFRSGDYDWSDDGDEPRNHRCLSEEMSHEAALRFVLWLYCEQRGLGYTNVFKRVLMPRHFPEVWYCQPQIGYHKHEEVINFVSYETKITRNNGVSPFAPNSASQVAQTA